MNERVGKVFSSNAYGDFEIVDYHNSKNVSIKFSSTGNVVNHLSWGNITRGEVKDNLVPSMYGVGYLGVGSFNSKSEYLGSSIYLVWRNMLKRCYSPAYQKTQPTYVGSTVCDEWHNFQDFAEWFLREYREGSELDKNLLKRGNKVYSPDNCIFISKEVNLVLSNKKKALGIRGVTGVIADKRRGGFIAQITYGKEGHKHLGAFSTLREAELTYLSARINRLTDLANEQDDIRVKKALFERSMLELKETVDKYQGGTE